MTTERVTLDLERKAIYAARVSAEAQGLSVDEWISKTVWSQAVIEGAKISAENHRRFPDEPPGWQAEVEARMLGEEER